MPSDEIYTSELLFLYWKALHLNADYQNFCRHMNGSGDGLVKDLIKNYHNIIPLHVLFGDLSAEYDNVDERAIYKKWLRQNRSKFIPTPFTRHEIVVEGEPITPQVGVVYYTIPKYTPAVILSHFFSASMSESVEQLNFRMKKLLMPVKQTNWLSDSKVQSTSKRLDVYYWAVYKPNVDGVDEPSNRQIMEKAYKSNRPHWRVLKSSLDEKIKNTPQIASIDQLPASAINSNAGSIRRLRLESHHLINNTLLGCFPSPAENDANAPILFGSIKDAVESGRILT